MKVGDYVRTEDGKIAKVIDIEESLTFAGYEKRVTTDKFKYSNRDMVIIKKSSPNIIDLIQVGDFVNYEQVNGGYVLNKNEDSIDTWAILPNSLKNEDIKSVITREQMKSLEYKVKE